ncbi:hypothetical protein QTL97_11745 [Sporosarcina thermotolerans]|uniref:Uncharacterized protein n=1 Tax=Sporosarcina thermotolerans TaxID=633404 RepID=A0AAW9A851_9BACL|nr:hypothetical protein [Sporosarcina thermotolerans]MDW0117612.1 hypothetical protein [Sporosarcina thermotolerans]WHT49756.1 hypothetical protein QNH10_09910 [Sporosarcina thermotolerans]
MDNDQFEKRMDFLKKSYDRVPSSFDPNEVFKKIDEEKVPQSNKQKSSNGGFRQHLTIWAMGIASIFIIGIIGAGYVLDQKQKSDEEVIQTPVTDEYIESLLKQYEEEREKRREMVKLDEVFFKHYASFADSTINLLKNESYLEMVSEGTEKTPLEETYNRAIEELKLPSEMLKDLKANSLNNDEQGSITFLGEYRRKIQMLIEIYDQILKENKEAIDAYEVGPHVDKAEIMLLSTKSFPEQLQNIIGTMRDQSIRLHTEKYSGEIRTRHNNYYFYYSDLAFNLHHHTDAYIQMMVEEPYMYGPILQYPLNEMAYKLGRMEQTLINVEQDHSLYPVLESYYLTIFNDLVKGSEYTKIFDEDGILLPDYQDVWRGMAATGDVSPLTYVMQPIVKEMEASGWRESESWNSLSYDALKDAITLAREGQLEYYMYGERPDFKSETIQFPNESFWNEVYALYEDFKKSYDKSVLKGASPIHVLGIFDYANEMDDPETMYHLYSESVMYSNYGEIELDDYVQNWRKGFSHFRNATEVRFDQNTVYREGLKFRSHLSFTGSDREVQMIFNEEGIWEVYSGFMETLPSYQMSPEIGFRDLLNSGEYTHRSINNPNYDMKYLNGIGALDMVGAYFYALSRGNYEVQYKLFFQGEGSEIVEKETYLENPEKYSQSPPYEDGMYVKASFQGLEQDENGNWPGVATLTVDTELYPNLPSEMKLHMFWTEEGWRVKFNPFE